MDDKTPKTPKTPRTPLVPKPQTSSQIQNQHSPSSNTLLSKLQSRPNKIRKLSSASRPPSSPPLSTPGVLDSALRHLQSADPLLAPLIHHYPPPSFHQSQPPFLALCKSILYQQLATKAATSLYTRFVSLCGAESSVLPDVVSMLPPQELRQIGVSLRKASYLHDLARKYQNGILSDGLILGMDDKSLFTILTMVNGIGSWSVHMFMIFSLHRPDVLPVHDLGIRKGVQMLLGLGELPRPSQMDQLCEKWRPYRSVAAWYVWRLVEAKGRGTNANGEQQQIQHHQPCMDPVLATWGDAHGPILARTQYDAQPSHDLR